MSPGLVSPATGPALASKDLAGPRKDASRAGEERSRFEVEAESLLESLAQNARPHPPGERAPGSGEDRLPGRETLGPQAGGSSAGDPQEQLGLAPITRDDRETPYNSLNQTRQSYGATEQRQRAALHPPGSLLNVEA